VYSSRPSVGGNSGTWGDNAVWGPKGRKLNVMITTRNDVRAEPALHMSGDRRKTSHCVTFLSSYLVQNFTLLIIRMWPDANVMTIKWLNMKILYNLLSPEVLFLAQNLPQTTWHLDCWGSLQCFDGKGMREGREEGRGWWSKRGIRDREVEERE